MTIKLDDLIVFAGDLPPLPQAAQKALSLIRDQKSSMLELFSVISLDPALTSLVLRGANSAFYGLGKPVSTVQQAIMVLGQSTLESLILTASVATYMDRPVPGYNLDRGELWKHAIGVAGGARIIAQPYGEDIAEEAYHAGLLCDIGKLAFESLLRDADTRRPDWQGHSFTELEQNHFGTDHASLGAEMARRWKLPESLVNVIANHHHPCSAGQNILLASAVHVADAAMMMLGIGIGKDGLQYNLDPVALTVLRWTEANLEDLFSRTSGLVDEASGYLGLV